MSFKADLLALRDGTLSFTAFEKRHRDGSRAWAAYFHQRWPQREHCIEDLIQEALIVTWRAVDGFDPSRGHCIEAHVRYCVGRDIGNVLSKATGWPRKDRGTKAIVPISLDAKAAAGYEKRDERTAEDLLFAEEVARKVGSFAEDVVRGVASGASFSAIAVHMYGDIDYRRRHRLTDPHGTVQKIRSTARKILASSAVR